MAIYTPGVRDRHNKVANKGARQVVAILSLTAMVDMFTVLVVFLLQNYSTDEALFKEAIIMPEAQAVKKLMTATVVAVTKNEVFVDNTAVKNIQAVQTDEDWMIQNLRDTLTIKIKERQDQAKSGLKNALKKSVADQATIDQEFKTLEHEAARVTVQAEKTIDFLTLKKIIHTATEAGASEINFAVLEKPKAKTQN